MSVTTTNNTFFTEAKAHIEQALIQALPAAEHDADQLHQAMRYAVLNGGKRLRPLLVFATGHCFGASLDVLTCPAMAVELIHCYSLVHDDLPAMDDDALRRGKPTCHIAFGEPTAILVGDALQSLAFQLLAQTPCLPEQLPALVTELANASGSLGMAGGQALDLANENHTISLDALAQCHRLKTGALIRGSLVLGALTAGCNDPNQLALLSQFGEQIGLAFQIQDDILDVEGNTEQLGKPAGSDQAHHKSTYPALMGLAQAKIKREQLETQALATLTQLPFPTDLLQTLCLQLTRRAC